MAESSPRPQLRELQSSIDAQLEQLIAQLGDVSVAADDRSTARRRLERLRSKLDEVFDEAVARIES